jgi:hypothetical protein
MARVAVEGSAVALLAGKLSASNSKIPAQDFSHALDKDRNSRTQHNNHSPKPPPAISAPH